MYWEEWYFKEESFLKKAILQAERISHIGSTAVPYIWAKSIIDILVEVPKRYVLSSYKGLIQNRGYICMAENENRIDFNKGYKDNGFEEKVFHLHLRYTGDNNELYFRDYLIEHSEIASEYENMKLKLWKKYEYNRDGYTSAKTDFVGSTRKKQNQYMVTDTNRNIIAIIFKAKKQCWKMV